MCVIVDTDCASLVFTRRSCDDMKPLSDAIFCGKARAMYGGRLLEEYKSLGRLRGVIVELVRQGRLVLVPNEQVDHQSSQVEQQCISNDCHIIGLALVSGARLLCSRDRDLHKDFTNPMLLQPKGAVYQNKSHKRLISKHCR